MIDATHNCVSCRGVKHHGASMQTAKLSGCFLQEDSARAEFYKNIELAGKMSELEDKYFHLADGNYIGGLTMPKEKSSWWSKMNNKMGKQLTIFDELEKGMDPSTGLSADVPFVNEVEIFNTTFGKPNNYEPTIPEKKRMAIRIRLYTRRTGGI